MALSTGYVLNNRYRIVRLIRRGGFGAVYRAWDLSLKRPCALKENTETMPAAAKQFSREASMLASLVHSNLPRVTDHFIVEGMGQYLVMDYVDGEDLQDLLDRSQDHLPTFQVLGWINQVGEALAYLHSRVPPVIHRDIKPANIRITPEGDAFLVDFGISKVHKTHIVTSVGAKAVTPGFSPPEQYSGAGTDNRSDIYALGATAYNLLTGETPPESVLRMAHTDTLKPPRSLNPAIGQSDEWAILKAMATNADQRFQRVEDFLAALTPPGGEPLPATQVVSPPMSGAAAVATVVSDRPEGDLVPAESPITSEGVAAAELAEQKSRRAGFLPWVLAGIGGVVVVLLVIFGFMWFGGGDEPDAGATQTWNAAIRMTVNAPTDTKPPPKATYTPYPTYTPIPTHTSAPVIAPTSTRRPPDPTNTRPPLPTSTSPPAQTDIKVSLRNNTGKDVNYYRVRPTGEMRYLGWVPPNYYGTYTFPSLGEHIIEFCERDADGNNSNCRRTTINVTSSGQEFSIK